MSSFWLLVLIAVVSRSLAATSPDIAAKQFIAEASTRYYALHDKFAAETYDSPVTEDFHKFLNKVTTLQTIAKELSEISQQASSYDARQLSDERTKAALKKLRRVGGLYALGEEFFNSVLLTFAAVKSLPTDRDIAPYGGAGERHLACQPDLQTIARHTNSTDELKYYWESWRERNLGWIAVNFDAIIEAYQRAAKVLDVPALDLWYERDNGGFILQEMERALRELLPAYKQLHAFIRRQLVAKYGADVQQSRGPIPDHLYHQVLEQVWSEASIIERYFPKQQLPLYDGFVRNLTALELFERAERFYTSMGFEPLGADFRKTQLKPHEATEEDGDCSADIFDQTPHVYMRYCRAVDFRRLMQQHGYVTRLYYARAKQQLPAYEFDSYNLEYPLGEAIILSASSPRYLERSGLAGGYHFSRDALMNRHFRMAMHTLLHLPLNFVHAKVMHDLINGTVKVKDVNKHYWRLMWEFAGVEPPSDRPENAIDLPCDFHAEFDENKHTKKFISEILGYQFYRALCQKANESADLQNCNFYGNLNVGTSIKSMMALGSSKPWREVIAEILPPNEQRLSSAALLAYYRPIITWLEKHNRMAAARAGWNATKRKIL